LLYDRPVGKIGKEYIFMDVDNIELGTNFEEELDKALERSKGDDRRYWRAMVECSSRRRHASLLTIPMISSGERSSPIPRLDWADREPALIRRDGRVRSGIGRRLCGRSSGGWRQRTLILQIACVTASGGFGAPVLKSSCMW